MKTFMCIAGLLIAFVQGVLAGGNSSVVKLDEIISVVIEDQRIIIRGNGMMTRRVVSDSEHGDSSIFGRPAQMMHARLEDAEFIVHPYFSETTNARVELKGMSEEKRKEYLEKGRKWWKETVAIAKKLKAGGRVTLGYQGDEMMVKGAFVTKIEGVGSIILPKEKK